MSEKDQELTHIEALLEKMEDPPSGPLTRGEDPPDGRIDTGDSITGVEHTRLYYPRSPNGVVRQNQEYLREQVAERAKEIFYKDRGEKLHVEIEFQTLHGRSIDPSDSKLRKNDVSDVAGEVADLVRQHVPEVGENREIRPNYPNDEFPRGVRSIWVWRSEHIAAPLWQSPEGGAVASLTPSFLKDRIADKEEQIDRYRERYSEVWLLMVAEGSQFSNWFDEEGSEEALDADYSTAFDRVFVLHGHPGLHLDELRN